MTSPPAQTPPAVTPPAVTPPAQTPPAETPPAVTPPAVTPPAVTPPAVTLPAVTLPAVTSLAVTLRTATRAEHEGAEGMPFVGALMAGRLPLDAYVDLLGQHHAVYGALEAAEPFVRADAAGRSLLVDGLARSAAIEADLARLRGPSWRDGVRTLPATARYVARLRAVAATWVGGYAAHAYTRYLGDLSGGLAIRSVLRRHYGLPDDALHFYTFATIPKPKLFKDEYRARLDALPLDAAERTRVAEEARLAFRLNTAVFADLGAAHLT